MGKISEHDTSKESTQVQEFVDEVAGIMNNGNYEILVVATDPPGFDAPQVPQLVLSKVGAVVKLFCSYLGTWYSVTLS